jgi:hypothetical protein
MRPYTGKFSAGSFRRSPMPELALPTERCMEQSKKNAERTAAVRRVHSGHDIDIFFSQWYIQYRAPERICALFTTINSQTRVSMRLLLTALCVSLFLLCMPSVRTATRYRTLHVSVIADAEYGENISWKSNIGRLIEGANDVFREWIDVEFCIDTMILRDSRSDECAAERFLVECILTRYPRRSPGIVVYFSRHRSAGYSYTGRSDAELGFVHVKQIGREREGDSYILAFHTLVHELAHLFGAVHVKHNGKQPCFMYPSLHEQLIGKDGVERTYRPPVFHPANHRIMRALRMRNFGYGNPLGVPWDSIAHVYQAVRAEFNPWHYSAEGEIVDAERNSIDETAIWYYLSSWAARCGKADIASAFLDSIERYYTTVAATCMDEPGMIRRDMCSECGHYKSVVNQWLNLQKAAVTLRKAELEANYGTGDSAQHYLDTYFALRSGIPRTQREKYLNLFSFYERLRHTITYH